MARRRSGAIALRADDSAAAVEHPGAFRGSATGPVVLGGEHRTAPSSGSAETRLHPPVDVQRMALPTRLLTSSYGNTGGIGSQRGR